MNGGGGINGGAMNGGGGRNCRGGKPPPGISEEPVGSNRMGDGAFKSFARPSVELWPKKKCMMNVDRKSN